MSRLELGMPLASSKGGKKAKVKGGGFEVSGIPRAFFITVMLG